MLASAVSGLSVLPLAESTCIVAADHLSDPVLQATTRLSYRYLHMSPQVLGVSMSRDWARYTLPLARELAGRDLPPVEEVYLSVLAMPHESKDHGRDTPV